MRVWMLLFFAFVLPGLAGARTYAQDHRPQFRMAVPTLFEGVTGQPYPIGVFGVDGRPLYGVTVSVYYSDSAVASGATDVSGFFGFTPLEPGVYSYRLDQGRYFSGGGWISVNASDEWLSKNRK